MSTDEQMAVIGRMVTERKELLQKDAVLSSQITKASMAFQSLSGLLANYKGSYNHPLSIPPGAAEFVDVPKLQELVSELLSTRAQMRELQDQLKQAGILLD